METFFDFEFIYLFNNDRQELRVCAEVAYKKKDINSLGFCVSYYLEVKSFKVLSGQQDITAILKFVAPDFLKQIEKEICVRAWEAFAQSIREQE